MTGLSCTAQTVKLDYYFNHETRKVANSQPERFHYLWTETDEPGYSKWGNWFKQQGFSLDTLGTAPTAANLKGAAVYIVVDPDSKKESAAPNYIQQKDVTVIAGWVKQGGVLVMLANDSANVELPHFNLLAGAFGMHFNNDLQNHFIDDAHFEDGAIYITNNPVFPNTKKVFMKDVCSISTTGSAKALLKNKKGFTVIAAAKYGKGTAVTIADPWLYNEYVNGRLPIGFENDKAAQDFISWLKKQISVQR
ncbi:hypothetical protein HH214_04920 [Mucilaginibacter robiniae]|uniref:DUF4350 domain-containing protein n=1 Tax=Mucilaginibacter robiniae TaxID=2728022 RepID=A0A7L5E3B3_9SPHI|nr:hypothetical protein [Mucilaginibacter robiniae]QJD95263.1 hypothetical protein HH214_04920 [Mucilaginibacter robiniae]